MKKALDILKATLDILEARIDMGLSYGDSPARIDESLNKIKGSLTVIDLTLNSLWLASLAPASPGQVEAGPAPRQSEPRTANLPERGKATTIQPPQPAQTVAGILTSPNTALPQIIEKVALVELSTERRCWGFLWPIIAIGAAIIGFITFRLVGHRKNKQEGISAGSVEILETPQNVLGSNINHEPLSPLT